MSTKQEPTQERARQDGVMYRLADAKEQRDYRNSRGQKVDSVTNVTKMLDKPALLFWAWSLGRDGMTLDQGRAPAANIGTVAHARCEAWLRDMMFDEAGIDPEVLRQSDYSLERFKQWWGEQGFQLDTTEYAMVSDEHNIGGRLDIRAFRGDGPAPKRVLLDLKTSKGFYSEMFLQVGGYAELQANPHLTKTASGLWAPAPPENVFEFDEVWIARIGKDEPGDMDAVEVPQSEMQLARRAFVGLARAYYDVKAVQARRK